MTITNLRAGYFAAGLPEAIPWLDIPRGRDVWRLVACFELEQRPENPESSCTRTRSTSCLKSAWWFKGSTEERGWMGWEIKLTHKRFGLWRLLDVCWKCLKRGHKVAWNSPRDKFESKLELFKVWRRKFSTEKNKWKFFDAIKKRTLIILTWEKCKKAWKSGGTGWFDIYTPWVEMPNMAGSKNY